MTTERAHLFGLMVLASASLGAEPIALVDASGFAPFHRLDSDRNGYVSRVEARIALGVREVFDSADANQDGLLDREEYSLARPAAEENW